MTKILFISRAYLPTLGGIERQNAGIAESLAKLTTIKIIANTRGKKFLPIFLPFAILKSIMTARKYDVVLFGDGVLSPFGRILKIFYPSKKYISIIHALDITFANKKSFLGKIYKKINIPSLKKLDKLFMVGNESIVEAEKIGIPKNICVFIPNGLEMDEICQNSTRKDLEKIIGMNLENKKVIFRGSRFVKHKGVEWFIRNVMPKLPENYILIAAGGGVAKKTAGDENNYSDCVKAAKDMGLENRIKFLLNVPRQKLKILFNTCDLFIAPNIKVPVSMEGFGITAIEAAACGKVVLASNLDGLKDAIKDGQNGFLLPQGNAESWIKKIIEVLSDENFRIEFGKRAKKYVEENFTWEKISKKYLEEIEKTIKE
jgi:glycosyltransferase involved in cell wall biosynthesis